MTNTWTQYAELARRLDSVRATEQARTAGIRASVAEMTTHADELENRLGEQKLGLGQLAQHLRFKLPRRMVPTEPEGPVDPSTDLAKAAGAIDRADAAGHAAADRGARPGLLPRWPATGRNLLVYGIAALVVVLAQATSFSRAGESTNPITVLFLIPLLAFGTAYTVLRVGTATRVPGTTPKTSTRLGFVLCFLAGPAVVALILLRTFSSR